MTFYVQYYDDVVKYKHDKGPHSRRKQISFLYHLSTNLTDLYT